MPIDISNALAGAAAAIDEAQGAGAKDIVLRVTLNIGVIHGGVKEHVEIEEFLHVVQMHVLSSFDYLSR